LPQLKDDPLTRLIPSHDHRLDAPVQDRLKGIEAGIWTIPSSSTRAEITPPEELFARVSSFLTLKEFPTTLKPPNPDLHSRLECVNHAILTPRPLRRLALKCFRVAAAISNSTKNNIVAAFTGWRRPS